MDALLGAPEHGWIGASAATSEPRFARGGREARGRRDLLLPALHALQSGVGLDQRGRPELRLRASDRAARRGVRRRDVLRDVQRRAAPEDRRARLRRPRVPRRGREGAAARLEGMYGPGGAAAATYLDRSPCLGLCERRRRCWSADGEAGRRPGGSDGRAFAADLSGRRGGRRAAPARRRRPGTGERAGLRLLRRVGVVDPSFDDYRAHGGYEALRRATSSAPRARSTRSPTRS